MSSVSWNPLSSGSAARPAHHSQDSSAARPADGTHNGKLQDGKDQDGKENGTIDLAGAGTPLSGATSVCLFTRLPPDMWRQVIGLLSYSDVAACACSSGHEDTKRLLIGYMRRRCCVSTFKRLLAEYGAIAMESGLWHPDCGEMWDSEFWKRSEERKHFWKRAIEIIFTYEPKLLLEDKPYQRCDPLIQQDYIHSCGVVFAPEANARIHRFLQRQFRFGYGADYWAQRWFRLCGFQYCLNGLNPGTHTAGTVILRERRSCLNRYTVLDSLLI